MCGLNGIVYMKELMGSTLLPNVRYYIGIRQGGSLLFGSDPILWVEI